MGYDDDDDQTIYKVVLNHEEQYSIWPADRENALGWRDEGVQGTKAECLAHIDKVWTDMRLLSLRKKMAEMESRREEFEAEAARRAEAAAKVPTDPRDDLVGFLCAGDHPVKASLRPEVNAAALREAIDRDYVHVMFTDTRGGTELGFSLDNEVSDLSAADFDAGSGRVRLAGNLTLNYDNVRCIAEIDLASLEGTGRLERVGS